MSDEELVKAVEVKIICPFIDAHRQSGLTTGWTFMTSTNEDWRLLTDWNDVMQVADIVSLQPYPIRAKFQLALMSDGKWFADVSQRDILEAALLAMEATP